MFRDKIKKIEQNKKSSEDRKHNLLRLELEKAQFVPEDARATKDTIEKIRQEKEVQRKKIEATKQQGENETLKRVNGA